MDKLAALILLAVGLLHLLPVTGVLGGERLQALYGLAVEDHSLAILLRHRAVLFALIGVALLLAALQPAWRGPAVAIGLISMLSFIVIALLEGGGNAAILRVLKIDLVASMGLLLVAGYDLLRLISGNPA